MRLDFSQVKGTDAFSTMTCLVDSYLLFTPASLLKESCQTKPLSIGLSRKLITLAMGQANGPEPSSLGELRAGIHLAAMQRLSDKASGWWEIGQLAKLPEEITDPSFTQAQRPRGLCPRSVNFSSSNRAQFPGHRGPWCPGDVPDPSSTSEALWEHNSDV